MRVKLAELERQAPGALQSWPDLSGASPQRTPVAIELAAWATDIAADLHARFADQLRLTVGAMSYPDGAMVRRAEAFAPPLTPAAEHGLRVALAVPVHVQSGHSMKAVVQVTSMAAAGGELHTNGHLSAVVIDSGERVVGAYVGAQHMPLVRFRLPPAEPVEVPLLIGTASLAPELGYAVPPGEWRLWVELPLGASDASAPSHCQSWWSSSDVTRRGRAHGGACGRCL